MNTRRDFLKTGLAGLLGAGVFPLGCSTPPVKGLNYLFITLDTTRRDHLGCYGYSKPTSPVIDQFAKEALLFEEAYSTSHITIPAHLSLFTGLHPYNTGVLFNGARSLLDARIPTIGSFFQEKGYDTQAITSARFLNTHLFGHSFNTVLHPTSLLSHSAEHTVNAFEKMLQVQNYESGDKPFLTWLHFWDPHSPYDPPEEHRLRFGQEKESALVKRLCRSDAQSQDLLSQNEKELVETTLGDGDIISLRARYEGEIHYMDSQLQRVFDSLKSRGLYDNTVIVLMADHGESLNDNGTNWALHQHVYEHVVRVPLLIKHPDYKARRVPGLVQSIDIVPTILNWENLQGDFDGKDLDTLVMHNTPLRDKVFLTRGNGIQTGSSDGKNKFIFTGIRKNPIAIPPSWKEESTLPEIKYAYDVDHIVFKEGDELNWKVPENIPIEKYIFYHLHGQSLNNEFTANVNPATILVQGNDIFVKGIPAEYLDAPTHIRLVGIDAAGAVVATSKVLPVLRQMTLTEQYQLFNLDTDPDERVNLAEQLAERIPELEKEITPFADLTRDAHVFGSARFRDEGIIQSTTISTEDLETLDALGYIE